MTMPMLPPAQGAPMGPPPTAGGPMGTQPGVGPDPLAGLATSIPQRSLRKRGKKTAKHRSKSRRKR